VIWRPTLLHCQQGGPPPRAEAVIGVAPPWRRAPPCGRQIEDPQLRPPARISPELRSQPELAAACASGLEGRGAGWRDRPALRSPGAPTAGRGRLLTARAAAGVAAALGAAAEDTVISSATGRGSLAVKKRGGVQLSGLGA